MIRLTVFADHDLKHSLAGGANVNAQENLKRIARHMKVRLLSSWEPGLAESETVDGIEIRRFRGNMASLRWTIPRYFKNHLENETDVVWDEVDFSAPWLSPLFTDKPVLMHCHHFQKNNFFYELPWLIAAGAYTVEPILYRLYRKSKVVAVSESTKKSLVEIGIPDGNITVSSPALDSAIFREWEDVWPKKSAAPTIVSLARLRAWKGVHFAIQAMPQILKQVPDCRLNIIGTGPYERELRNLTEKLNLSQNVFFLGRLESEAKLDRLKESWLLTKTSAREGWGIDVLEANACASPAVGWNVAGTRDSIQHNRTGRLVPFGDVAGLSREAAAILLDRQLREKMARESFDFCRQFTWDASAEKISRVISGMV